MKDLNEVINHYVPAKVLPLIEDVQFHVLKNAGDTFLPSLDIPNYRELVESRIAEVRQEADSFEQVPDWNDFVEEFEQGEIGNISGMFMPRFHDNPRKIYLPQHWNTASMIHEIGHAVEDSLYPLSFVIKSIDDKYLSEQLLTDQMEEIADLKRVVNFYMMMRLPVIELIKSRVPFFRALQGPGEYFAEAFMVFTGAYHNAPKHLHTLRNDGEPLEGGQWYEPDKIPVQLTSLFTHLKEFGTPDGHTSNIIHKLQKGLN